MQEILIMPLLQVRGCPEDLYKKVALVAKRQNRTIAQQVVVLLEKGLGQEESNREKRKQLLAKIESRSVPEKAKTIGAVALIREERDK
jgi:hypothetical protein